MSNNASDVAEWETIIDYLNKLKPNYGNIVLDLIYHQGQLKKLKIVQKEDVFSFNKIQKEGEKNEK